MALLSLCAPSDGLTGPYREAEKEPWSFGLNAYYGALFVYRVGMPILHFSHPYSVELYANRHTIGKRPWERRFRHPQIGFAFSHYLYGVPDELGGAYALTSYLDNLVTQSSKGSLRFSIGTGLVYSTRYYIPEVNEGNMAIGSRYCFALRGNLRYEAQLSEKLFLNLNLAFRHFSNGSLNRPNNGMNFPLVGLGIRYQPKEIRFLPVQDTLACFNRKFHLNLKLSTGRKEVLRIDEKHPVHSLSFYASRRLSPISAVMVGADAFHDSALRHEFRNKHLTPPEGVLDPRLVGVTLGHELYLGKMSFVFQYGRYIYKPYPEIFKENYQRYGLKYLVARHLSASAMLLAHSGTANVIEWGMGVHL
ncbi:hypothetical protein BH24BAC1_BH24BAC1_01330 [soil metagenome]